jgi:hypothetical protein
MTFDPNPNAVLEAVENMLRRQVGGGHQTIEDCMWWAFEHKHSYNRGQNGYIFWQAVYDKFDEIYKHGMR